MRLSKINNFSDDFRQCVKHITDVDDLFNYDLFESLTSLTFNKNFNKSVDNLPRSLTSLKFGYYFNSLIT